LLIQDSLALLDNSGNLIANSLTLTVPLSISDGGTGNATLTPYAVTCGGTTSTSPLQSIASVGASGQILTSNGAGNLPTFQNAIGGLTWNNVTSSPQALVASNGYVANAVGLIIFTLPATAAFGAEYEIIGKGNGMWRLNQNAGQQIVFGISNTTLGVTGSVVATNKKDCVRIICTDANVEFTITNCVGNPTIN